MGKIDFPADPDPNLNQAIKEAIVGGATAKIPKQPSPTQPSARPIGAAKSPPPPNPNYLPPQR